MQNLTKISSKEKIEQRTKYNIISKFDWNTILVFISFIGNWFLVTEHMRFRNPSKSFNLSIFKADVISCFLSPSSDWDFHFRRNLRDPEVVELSSLLILLRNSHLSPSHSDARLWSLTSSVLFFVSSLFSVLSALIFGLFPHKTVWISPLLLKFKHFFGKLLGIVPPPGISSNLSIPT